MTFEEEFFMFMSEGPLQFSGWVLAQLAWLWDNAQTIAVVAEYVVFGIVVALIVDHRFKLLRRIRAALLSLKMWATYWWLSRRAGKN